MPSPSGARRMVERQDIDAARHPLSLAQAQALAAIRTCRTAVLGGHVEAGDTCGALKISSNACRNRHCPQCQTLASARRTAGDQVFQTGAARAGTVVSIASEKPSACKMTRSAGRCAAGTDR